MTTGYRADCKLREDLPVGVYHSFDDVKNLKIRVLIRKIASASLSVIESLSSSDLIKDEQSDETRISFVEYTFKWQEKVLPKFEKHDDPKVQNLCSSILDAITLFSCVNNEANTASVLYVLGYSKGKKDSMKVVSQSLENKSCQMLFYPEIMKIMQTSSKKSHLTMPYQTMSIIARLNTVGSFEDIELCNLYYNDSGALIVVPDFSRNKTSYTIQSSKSETYEYVLEHVSSTITKSDALNEKKLINKITLCHRNATLVNVGSQFIMPPLNTMSYNLIGEIVAAENFKPGNICIRYIFELPKGWKSINDESLNGSTYVSKTKTTSNVELAHFGFCFKLEVEIDLKDFLKGSSSSAAMIFEVSSIDKWNNSQCEGYGFWCLPVSAGSLTTRIKTWKLLPQSLTEKLRSYFISESLYLDNFSYIRIPVFHQGMQISKYGVKTEASGALTLRSSLVLQSAEQSS